MAEQTPNGESHGQQDPEALIVLLDADVREVRSRLASLDGRMESLEKALQEEARQIGRLAEAVSGMKEDRLWWRRVISAVGEAIVGSCDRWSRLIQTLIESVRDVMLRPIAGPLIIVLLIVMAGVTAISATWGDASIALGDLRSTANEVLDTALPPGP